MLVMSASSAVAAAIWHGCFGRTASGCRSKRRASKSLLVGDARVLAQKGLGGRPDAGCSGGEPSGVALQTAEWQPLFDVAGAPIAARRIVQLRPRTRAYSWRSVPRMCSTRPDREMKPCPTHGR
jgi:hypothetical protein